MGFGSEPHVSVWRSTVEYQRCNEKSFVGCRDGIEVALLWPKGVDTMRALTTPTVLMLASLLTGCFDWTLPPPRDADLDGDTADAGDGDAGCQCTDGACCDGCSFLGVETRCADEALSSEYRCDEGCGGDALRRGVFRHCSGTSAECPADVLRLGDWEVLQDCASDQILSAIMGSGLD